jgi:replication-associated recombination protein RarA
MASALILFAIAMPFLYAARKLVHDLVRSIGHTIGGPLRPEHFVSEQYLPDQLSDSTFYEPSDQGAERETAARQRKRWEP